MEKELQKREYVKPTIVTQRDIEALTSVCESGGANTMQDKLSFDGTVCMAPMT